MNMNIIVYHPLWRLREHEDRGTVYKRTVDIVQAESRMFRLAEDHRWISSTPWRFWNGSRIYVIYDM